MYVTRTARVGGPALCLAALCAPTMGSATASADPTVAWPDTIAYEQNQDCRGASPNVLEAYKVSIRASQMTEPVVGSEFRYIILHSTTFQRPFPVTATLTWKNQATGAHGSIPLAGDTERKQLFTPALSVLGSGEIRPGKGLVQFTLRAQPHGGKQVPATVCVANFPFR